MPNTYSEPRVATGGNGAPAAGKSTVAVDPEFRPAIRISPVVQLARPWPLARFFGDWPARADRAWAGAPNQGSPADDTTDYVEARRRSVRAEAAV